MGRVAPKVAPPETPARPPPAWKKDLPDWMRRLLDAAKKVARPEAGEGEFLVRLRPNVFKHENTEKPALRWKTNAWPAAFIRLIEKRGSLRGTFRTEGRHWLLLRPEKPEGGHK